MHTSSTCAAMRIPRLALGGYRTMWRTWSRASRSACQAAMRRSSAAAAACSAALRTSCSALLATTCITPCPLGPSRHALPCDRQATCHGTCLPCNFRDQALHDASPKQEPCHAMTLLPCTWLRRWPTPGRSEQRRCRQPPLRKGCAHRQDLAGALRTTRVSAAARSRFSASVVAAAACALATCAQTCAPLAWPA